MKILCLSYILIFVILFANVSNSNCQDSDSLIISEITKRLDDIRVDIIQYKFLKESPSTSYCKAKVLIYKNERLIDLIRYDYIDPVGSHYGLLAYDSLINNHIVISKYGDYSGETIIINKSGEKFFTIGGYSCFDNSSSLLFSILDSDLSGLSVFDLNTDSEIFKVVDIEDRPSEIFKTDKGQYYFSATNDESGAESIWAIDFDLERIMQIELTKDYFANGPIEMLSDYKEIIINCEK
jgi:hypothetical protein